MAKLSTNDIKKLADLARIELSSDEIERYRGELTEILDYVEKLNAVDTRGLKPTLQVNGLTNVTRRDEEINYGYDPKDLLKNVPKTKDNFIEAKRMID